MLLCSHVCAQLSKHMDFKYLPALESQLGRFLRQLDASEPNGIGQADCGQLPVRAKPAAGDALLHQGDAGDVPPPHVPGGEPGLNHGPDKVFANPLCSLTPQMPPGCCAPSPSRCFCLQQCWLHPSCSVTSYPERPTAHPHHVGGLHMTPQEPIWFQTQGQDHLICIFPHLRVLG